MKSLHVFHHSDVVNGVDRTTLTLMRALQRLGHDVSALVPAEGDVTAALDKLDVEYRVSALGCCQGPARRAELRFLARAAERAIEIQSWIAKVGAEVVHINTGHLLDAAVAACRAGVPGLWHIHAPFAIDYQRYERFLPPSGYAWCLTQLGQHVIAVSEDVRQSILEHLPADQVTLLYNGIDVEELDERAQRPASALHEELGIPRDSPIVMGVGRISAQKDFATFVRVARQVVDRLPATHFAIVGPAEDRELAEALPAQIRSLALEKHVHVLGPRADVPALLKQASAFLSTAIFEGQGLAALEAMAMKLPVVAMDCVGLRECIQSGVDGYLVPLGDDTACAEELVRVLGNSGEANRIGQQARRSVLEKYSADAYALGFSHIATRSSLQAQTFQRERGAGDFVLGMLREFEIAFDMIQSSVPQPGIRSRLRNVLNKLSTK